MSRNQQDHQSKNRAEPLGMTDPEVTQVAKRRHFSRAYKLRILAEVEQCQYGEVGTLLRREGLYSSVLSKWRQQKAAGKLDRPTGSQDKRAQDPVKELRRLRSLGEACQSN